MIITTIEAHRGAKCCSCNKTIKKGETALENSCCGAHGGDTEFTCVPCIKKRNFARHLRELAQEINDLLLD